MWSFAKKDCRRTLATSTQAPSKSVGLTSLVRRSGNFPQECDQGPTHTILGFQAQVEAQAIDQSHLGILGLNVSKPLRGRMSASLWSAFM